MIVMIADDIYIVGPPPAAATAFTDYNTGVTRADGDVNMIKSLAWSPTPASLEHEDIQALGNHQSKFWTQGATIVGATW